MKISQKSRCLWAKSGGTVVVGGRRSARPRRQFWRGRCL